MSGLEIALIVLVLIWSLILLIAAVFLVFLFWQVKKWTNKVNRFMDKAEEVSGKAMGGASLVKEIILAIIRAKRKKR